MIFMANCGVVFWWPHPNWNFFNGQKQVFPLLYRLEKYNSKVLDWVLHVDRLLWYQSLQPMYLMISSHLIASKNSSYLFLPLCLFLAWIFKQNFQDFGHCQVILCTQTLSSTYCHCIIFPLHKQFSRVSSVNTISH